MKWICPIHAEPIHCYIETKTNPPRKIKKYSRGDPNDDYVLEETLVVEYPTTDEIRKVIKDAGFEE